MDTDYYIAGVFNYSQTNILVYKSKSNNKIWLDRISARKAFTMWWAPTRMPSQPNELIDLNDIISAKSTVGLTTLITYAISQSYIVPLASVYIGGVLVNAYVLAASDKLSPTVYFASNDTTCTRDLPLIIQGQYIGTVAVRDQKDIPCSPNYPPSRRYAIINAAKQLLASPTNEFNPVVVKNWDGFDFMHYSLIISHDPVTKQTYFGGNTIHAMVEDYAGDTSTINSAWYMLARTNYDDYCMTVVPTKLFLEWFEGVACNIMVQALTDEVLTYINRVVAPEQPIIEPLVIEQPSQTITPITPTHDSYCDAVVNLAETWTRNRAPKHDEETAEEYQRAFLRDCSEAYAALLANKTAFKITFS